MKRGFAAVATSAAAIAGCTGGSGPNCGFGPCSYPIDIPNADLVSLSISPRQTVQVGTPVTIRASAVSGAMPLGYAWCRSARAGASCVTLGDTTDTLVITAASLSDDGAAYQVTVTAPDRSTKSASTQIFVSSMPGVLFTDGDFVDADWTATAIVLPANIASTYSVTRVADGGNPGSYRKIGYDVLPSGDVSVLHERSSAAYDPASQGAIHAIDFSVDCRLASSAEAYTTVLLEQGGRRYTAIQAGSVDASGHCTGAWHAEARPSFTQEDFVRVDGPACNPGETCPDFSATAAPMRLGMLTHAFVGGPAIPGSAAFHFEHGIDNWKVTVWRR